jgi:hypothetical protein
VRSVTGYLTLEGGDAIHGDNPRTTYNQSMGMLPLHAHIRVLKLTSKKIQEQEKHVTATGEIPKNFKIFPAFVTCGNSHSKTLSETPTFGRTDLPLSIRDVCS